MTKFELQDTQELLQAMLHVQLELKAAYICIQMANSRPVSDEYRKQLKAEAEDIAQRLLNLHAQLNSGKIQLLVETLRKAA